MCVCCCCCCFIAKSCPTLWDAMACSSPGSTVHVISQARILEWVAISFSRGSSQPRDGTSIYGISCLAVGLFTTEPSGKLMYLCIFCNWEKQKTKNKLLNLAPVGFFISALFLVMPMQKSGLLTYGPHPHLASLPAFSFKYPAFYLLCLFSFLFFFLNFILFLNFT